MCEAVAVSVKPYPSDIGMPVFPWIASATSSGSGAAPLYNIELIRLNPASLRRIN